MPTTLRSLNIQTHTTQLKNSVYASLRADIFLPSSYVLSEVKFIKINEDASFCREDDQNLFRNESGHLLITLLSFIY